MNFEKLENVLNKLINEMVKQEGEIFVANYLNHLGLSMKEIYELLDAVNEKV